MNNFDAFVDETDKELQIDTSTRPFKNQTLKKSNDESIIRSSTPTPIPTPTSPNPNGARIARLQSKLSPTTVSSGEDPLNDNQSNIRSTDSSDLKVISPRNNVFGSHSSRASMMNKRRSLIQPMVFTPSTPERTKPTQANTNSSIISNPSSNNKRNSLFIPDHDSQPSLHSRTSSIQSANYISDSIIIPPQPSTTSTTIDPNPNLNNSDPLDINSLLTNLANKELELFESKQKIDDLKKKLQTQEDTYKQHAKELQSLKEQVSKYFLTSQPHEDNMAARGTQPLLDSNDFSSSQSYPRYQVDQKNGERPKSSLWTKPLAIFNQFDQIIQQELEKSINWDDEEVSPVKGTDTKMDMNSATNSTTRGNQDVPQQQTAVDNSSVSKSIWSFVNDVKSGILGINLEENNESVTGVLRDRSRETSDKPPSEHLKMKEFKTTLKQKKSNKLQFIESVEEEDEEDSNNNAKNVTSQNSSVEMEILR